MSQFETLPIVLEASISPNSVVIKQAEEQLKNFAQTPGKIAFDTFYLNF